MYKYLFFAGLLCCFLSCKESDNNTVADHFKLNKTEMILLVGAKETLSIVETPISGETAVWTSDNKNVATVFFGEVTAIATGTATITVTIGNYSAQCKVSVPERSYRLVWSDEFNGTTLNTDNWNYEIGTGNWGWGNDEKQYYTNRPENIRLENGYLIIEARKEAYNGSNYTSARITTRNKQNFIYGKIEARISVPSGAGTWPAFWMLGYGNWPSAGEIDIMEHVGKEPTMFSHALHTKNQNGMNGKNWNSRKYYNNAENTFHTFTAEWIKDDFAGYDCIRFYIDETLTGASSETLQTTAEDWPFRTPFYLILNMAIGGNWGGNIDDTIFDQAVQMKIDYVKVYQYE